MLGFDLINFVMDFVLLLLAFWMVWAARGLGGVVGQSMNLVTAGAVILGLAHLSETILFEFFHIEAAFGEFIHRLVILLGFVFLTLGLNSATKIIRHR